jgi:hypothetical protein
MPTKKTFRVNIRNSLAYTDNIFVPFKSMKAAKEFILDTEDNGYWMKRKEREVFIPTRSITCYTINIITEED